MAGVQQGLAEAEAAGPASAIAAMDIDPETRSISSSSSTPMPASPVANAAQPQSGFADRGPCKICGDGGLQKEKYSGKCRACWRMGKF